MSDFTITGTDLAELDAVLAAGTDHGGNPVEPFVDDDGGWPLRCCLDDSRPGALIAIIAWSPFPWKGAYAEIGPVVVHTGGCAGPADPGDLPTAFDERAMTLRPYGPDRTIAYHRVQHVAAGDRLGSRIDDLLNEDDVAFVHARNVTGGCYAFTASR